MTSWLPIPRKLLPIFVGILTVLVDAFNRVTYAFSVSAMVFSSTGGSVLIICWIGAQMGVGVMDGVKVSVGVSVIVLV